MSSPLARPNKRWIERAIVRLHRDMSHDRRVRSLSGEIAGELSRRFSGTEGTIAGVDIGCGDMGIAEGISSFWPRVEWECLDIYELPVEREKLDPRWQKYRRFDGQRIDRLDKSADFALFTDVLHHVPEDGRLPLLKEAARVANTVIVKDHLGMERGAPCSGPWTSLAAGVWVSVPRRWAGSPSGSYATSAAS
ncbi:MAG: methyltransferase domain-containing protein [Cryobacterium sp.]|nr:methyltransferase domain-containing protein [Cryobacterium sp.]